MKPEERYGCADVESEVNPYTPPSANRSLTGWMSDHAKSLGCVLVTVAVVASVIALWSYNSNLACRRMHEREWRMYRELESEEEPRGMDPESVDWVINIDPPKPASVRVLSLVGI